MWVANLFGKQIAHVRAEDLVGDGIANELREAARLRGQHSQSMFRTSHRNDVG